MPEAAVARKRQPIINTPRGIDPDAVYTFRQFIDLLHISPATGWRLVSRGPRHGGIAVCRLGRRTLFRGSAIREMLERASAAA